MELKEILNGLTLEDNNVIKLPNIQLDRNEYLKVKKLLESNGGKWKGGKTQEFVFDSKDATPVLERLKGGDLTDRKKAFQFFETPENVARELASRLGSISPYDRILEPSAGKGALVKALPEHTVDCYELMEENREALRTVPNARLIGKDFMEEEVWTYDKIIANPPFSNSQDVRHVTKMIGHLAEGGTLVTVMSRHWQYANDRKSKEFRSLIGSLEHDITVLPQGTFKTSGTQVETVILTIRK